MFYHGDMMLEMALFGLFLPFLSSHLHLSFYLLDFRTKTVTADDTSVMGYYLIIFCMTHTIPVSHPPPSDPSSFIY